MKDIQKLLKSEAGSVLPDEKIKENIRRDLGIADEAREREFSLAGNAGGSAADGAKRRNRLLAIVLACVAFVLCLILVIVPLMKKDASSPNKFNPIGTVSDFYAYGAASVGSIIATLNAEDGAAGAAQSLSMASPAEQSEEGGQTQGTESGQDGVSDSITSVTDSQLETINKYMALVENVLSEGNIRNEVSESDREDKETYPVKNVVSYTDLTGGKISYTLYYNETLVKTETDEGEREDTYRIEGIMLVEGDETEYPIEGQREQESERGESENESWFRADLGGGDYIKVTQETEEEEGEQEQEFKYTVCRGGVVETTTLEYESERGETELKMTVRRGDQVDVLEFEEEIKGNERCIKVEASMDGERVRFEIRITTVNGESFYRYEFKDGYRDFGRHDDHDD